MLHYVTLTLDVYQVCHCVGRCVRYGSESQRTLLLGHVTISTNVRCYYRVVYNNFVIQQEGAPMKLAFNRVQLLQCKNVNFLSPELWPHNSPELNSIADYEI